MSDIRVGDIVQYVNDWESQIYWGCEVSGLSRVKVTAKKAKKEEKKEAKKTREKKKAESEEDYSEDELKGKKRTSRKTKEKDEEKEEVPITEDKMFKDIIKIKKK